MAELLVELFSEEIPARMQARAADDLKRLATDAFKAAALQHTNARAFVTPRRLALSVEGLPVAQADVKEERRGPRVDAPQQAIDGFLRANGVTLDQCEKRDTGKGTFYFAVVEKKGRKTADVLAELLPNVFGALPWPKSMRWGDGEIRWVRPLHSILSTFDGQVVKLQFAGLESGDTTCGHRFLAPKPFTAKSLAEYKDHLRSAYVMLDPAERRETIASDAALLAQDEGLQLKRDEGLLDEVTGLVEWPVALLGSIDQQFMDVPPEVLTTAMRAHQKYFALQKSDGSLAPRFVVIANMLTEDGGKQVVAGNERVLRARLSDARFFWDQDRKQKLESRVPSLKEIVFHAKLGTVAEKVARIETLAAELCEYVPGADRDAVRSAALLCKADLVTGMVGEFPELQGVMGRYYALHDGEKPAVANAIAEHYSPKGPDDTCPSAPVSVAVALADKIDTLVGFFAIDEKPTGSRDPFALRRAALGAIRLVLENSVRVPLLTAFDKALSLYPPQLPGEEDTVAYAAARLKEGKSGVGKSPENPRYYVAGEVLEFFADRLKVALREKGVRHDLIDAVFALGGEDDLVRLMARVDALTSFLASEDGANLLTAYRRASNIVTIEEKKDKTTYGGAVDAALLSQAEEQTLAKVLAEAQVGTKSALEKEDFTGAMTVLALLRKPVDSFFDKVTVNAEDKSLRANRLRLLSQIRATLGGVADFSRIVEG
jgi:glycyl-tRNA synthetase beta chain